MRAIHNDTEHAEALAEIEKLMHAEAGTLDGDRLEVLTILVDAYEREHHPILPPDPIDAIRFRMEQLGLTRRDLDEILGSKSRATEVLQRKRRLSVDMIRRLHDRLAIPAETLLVDCRKPVRKSARKRSRPSTSR
jgi:HTH-type transcriptional regulator / antitoxin HigA